MEITDFRAIENKDRPISPLKLNEVDEKGNETIDIFSGLSKKEYAAIQIMQGLRSNQNLTTNSSAFIAKLAIEDAEELLKQLEK